MTLESALSECMSIDGAIGVSLVDYQSGMALGTEGSQRSFNLEVASAGNTEVVRAKMRTIDSLDLNDDIEDILITLGKQYHLIRLLDKPGRTSLFLYLALERGRANLALARHQLKRIEGALSL